jgi:uncharacterized membrane protein YhaH (DUF805 family)
MNTLFNPTGRIGPVTFRNHAMILIGISAILGLAPLVMPNPLLGIIGLALMYPWAVLWIKRFHDAGKTGWMFLAVLVVWLGVGIAANFLIVRRFAPPQAPVNPGDVAAVMANASAQMQATAIPATIVSLVIVLAVVLVGNALLKADPAPNAYGPPGAA